LVNTNFNTPIAVESLQKLSKSYCERNKLDKWKWQLKKIMAEHGHTISLLQAALIIDSMPHNYNYEDYSRNLLNEYYAELNQQHIKH
jgi:hypothetical protein